MIPKNIFQTFHDKKQLTSEYLENQEDIAKLNPYWKLQLFDDQDIIDFIKTEFDVDILNTYLSINREYGAARADLFRYLIIYRYGGLYLDIKSTTTKSLDTVIHPDDNFIASVWPLTINGIDTSKWGHHSELGFTEYQNWFILSSPGNKILELVIENVCSNIANYKAFTNGVGRLAVLRTTGPIAYSKVVHHYVTSAQVRLISNEELGLKYSIFDFRDSEKYVGKSKNYRYLLTPLVFKSRPRSIAVKWYFRFGKYIKLAETRIGRVMTKIRL